MQHREKERTDARIIEAYEPAENGGAAVDRVVRQISYATTWRDGGDVSAAGILIQMQRGRAD